MMRSRAAWKRVMRWRSSAESAEFNVARVEAARAGLVWVALMRDLSWLFRGGRGFLGGDNLHQQLLRRLKIVGGDQRIEDVIPGGAEIAASKLSPGQIILGAGLVQWAEIHQCLILPHRARIVLGFHPQISQLPMHNRIEWIDIVDAVQRRRRRGGLVLGGFESGKLLQPLRIHAAFVFVSGQYGGFRGG